jgi:hypothetical protein
MSVAPGLLHIQDVPVAGFTNFVAGERDRLGRDFLEGVTPKMAVAAKALGDEDAPEDKEKNQAQEENGGHAKEVVYVFEANHRISEPTKIDQTFVHIPSERTTAIGQASHGSVT